jgi:hypothetical protein
MGQAEQDGQNKTTRTGQDCQQRAVSIGLLGYDSQSRTVSKGEAGQNS